LFFWEKNTTSVLIVGNDGNDNLIQQKHNHGDEGAMCLQPQPASKPKYLPYHVLLLGSVKEKTRKKRKKKERRGKRKAPAVC
jgi:hypothetical protein